MQKGSTEIVNGPATNEKYVTGLFDCLDCLYVFLSFPTLLKPNMGLLSTDSFTDGFVVSIIN